MQTIRVKRSDYNNIMGLARAGRKIEAIKELRHVSFTGLREAKEAIEYEMNDNPTPVAKMSVVAPWKIESITVIDSNTGNRVELSVSDLELKFLQETPSIGMDAVADLLNLTEYLKKWQKDVNN